MTNKSIILLNSINANNILECYFNLETNIKWNENNKGKQAGLQYRNNEDFWASAVGMSKGNELSYNKLNPIFENTIFESIINKYNLKRTRLMWVDPFRCYTMHIDTTPRIHIPLITNPECYFLFKDDCPYHLEKGSVYWVDTKFRHTFINCSKDQRLHLVGIIEK
jgi:hypothetical protein